MCLWGTLQCTSIKIASTIAGVVGSSKEQEKDSKHRELVENSGVSFVVESLGLYAKRIFSTIASRTTMCSGMGEKMAYCNLMEQPSFKFWQYDDIAPPKYLAII